RAPPLGRPTSPGPYPPGHVVRRWRVTCAIPVGRTFVSDPASRSGCWRTDTLEFVVKQTAPGRGRSAQTRRLTLAEARFDGIGAGSDVCKDLDLQMFTGVFSIEHSRTGP